MQRKKKVGRWMISLLSVNGVALWIFNLLLLLLLLQLQFGDAETT